MNMSNGKKWRSLDGKKDVTRWEREEETPGPEMLRSPAMKALQRVSATAVTKQPGKQRKKCVGRPDSGRVTSPPLTVRGHSEVTLTKLPSGSADSDGD